MTRAKLMMLGMALALIAVFAAPAQAQDGPTLTVEPATVDAAGEQEFTVTGEGWTATPPIFVLPCTIPESGDAADIDVASCDTGNLTPGQPEDGSFTVTVTYDVPAEGMAIVAGDAAQTEAAGAVVTVGAADSGEGEGEGEDGAAEDEGAEDEELANTGVESGLLAIIGVAVIAGGTMVVRTSRRHV